MRFAIPDVECGTHCVIDAGFWPCHTSERVGGFRLLRSVKRGMLLLWDRGFHDFDMVLATRRRGAHGLGRLPAHVKPIPLRTLSDGSMLAALEPSDYARRQRGERILVRVITSTITDPALPGYGEEHRLITTLLNPRVAPAHIESDPKTRWPWSGNARPALPLHVLGGMGVC